MRGNLSRHLLRPQLSRKWAQNNLTNSLCDRVCPERKPCLDRRPITSLLSGNYSNKTHVRRPWHNPEFMQESSSDDVEKWLLSLIQSANAKDKGLGSRSSNSSHNPIVYFDEDFNVDAIAYLRILEAYARSSAPQKAEYWIGILERHHSAALELFCATYDQITNNTHQQEAAAIVRSLQPTVECYNAIIEVWGHDKNPISVVRSRRWLTKLEDAAKNTSQSTNSHLSLALHSPLRPNGNSYDLYLHSCSRGTGKQPKQHHDWAEQAERILDYRLSSGLCSSLRPKTESFNYVLRAYTRCRRDLSVADKAMSVVRRMEKIKNECLLTAAKGDGQVGWKQNIAPNSKTYAMLLDAWVIKAGLKANKWRLEQLAWNNTSKQRARDGKIRKEPLRDDGTEEMKTAEMIVDYIHGLDCTAQQSENDVLANVVAYNILLSGWARLANEIRQDVPLKSEKLLHDMVALAERGHESAAPDVTSFNAVIKAWGRTKQPNSADRCEYWLRKMVHANCCDNYQREKNLIVKPNVQTYNLVMDAHIKLSDAPRAQDMLLEMDATNGATPPNNESFSKVIRAWLADELHHNQYDLPGSSLEKAWKWFDELLRREKKGKVGLGPAPDLFSSILKTTARTSARGENVLTIGVVFYRPWCTKRRVYNRLI